MFYEVLMSETIRRQQKNGSLFGLAFSCFSMALSHSDSVSAKVELDDEKDTDKDGAAIVEYRDVLCRSTLAVTAMRGYSGTEGVIDGHAQNNNRARTLFECNQHECNDNDRRNIP